MTGSLETADFDTIVDVLRLGPVVDRGLRIDDVPDAFELVTLRTCPTDAGTDRALAVVNDEALALPATVAAPIAAALVTGPGTADLLRTWYGAAGGLDESQRHPPIGSFCLIFS